MHQDHHGDHNHGGEAHEGVVEQLRNDDAVLVVELIGVGANVQARQSPSPGFHKPLHVLQSLNLLLAVGKNVVVHAAVAASQLAVVEVHLLRVARVLRQDPGVEKQLQILVEPRAAQEAALRRARRRHAPGLARRDQRRVGGVLGRSQRALRPLDELCVPVVDDSPLPRDGGELDERLVGLLHGLLNLDLREVEVLVHDRREDAPAGRVRAPVPLLGLQEVPHVAGVPSQLEDGEVGADSLRDLPHRGQRRGDEDGEDAVPDGLVLDHESGVGAEPPRRRAVPDTGAWLMPRCRLGRREFSHRVGVGHRPVRPRPQAAEDVRALGLLSVGVQREARDEGGAVQHPSEERGPHCVAAEPGNGGEARCGAQREGADVRHRGQGDGHAHALHGLLHAHLDGLARVRLVEGASDHEGVVHADAHQDEGQDLRQHREGLAEEHGDPEARGGAEHDDDEVEEAKGRATSRNAQRLPQEQRGEEAHEDE
mmetsp:Transcript_6989/g.14895  ORF Transcript_6989/g.14895 Transcript_6989/m.14895 type:complete len:482 (-) Transcript_6989:910-2355(-)